MCAKRSKAYCLWTENAFLVALLGFNFQRRFLFPERIDKFKNLNQKHVPEYTGAGLTIGDGEPKFVVTPKYRGLSEISGTKRPDRARSCLDPLFN